MCKTTVRSNRINAREEPNEKRSGLVFIPYKHIQLATMSIGRGRGWNANKESPLRRPGVFAGSSPNDVAQSVLDAISKLDTDEPVPPHLGTLISTINKDILKNVCDTVWRQALIDNSFTNKVAIIFSDNKIALLEDSNGDSVRSSFLRLLQDNYVSKDKARVEKKKMFANMVLLHADVYYHMKLSDNKRLPILAEPLICYLEDLLEDNPRSNILFILVQILRSGKELNETCSQRLKSLMMKIRKILVKENLTPEDRAMLLLTIELTSNNFEVPELEVKYFYLSVIKTISFEYPFALETLKVVAEPTLDGKQLENSDGNQEVVTIERKITSSSEDTSYISNNSNVPRAIRGSGALDKNKPKKDGVNSRLNSCRQNATPNQQKPNKGWDHDDRFHKDYE